MEPTTLDSEYLKARLSSFPFIVVDGVFNIRSLGDYPSETEPGYATRSNFAFRSGAIAGITLNGELQLKNLGVKKIFDLRSDIETVKFGHPAPQLRFGIETERIPLFKDEDFSPEILTSRSNLYKSGTVQDILKIYEDILLGSGPALSAILKHILSCSNDAFVFHCTAGKDRTGVLAAILLKLAGVNDEIIVEDYALSRIGTEPQKDATIAKLIILDDYKDDMPGLLRALDTRPETMKAFLSLLETKYGGVEGFLSNYLGFPVDEIQGIRGNLLHAVVSPTSSSSGQSKVC